MSQPRSCLKIIQGKMCLQLKNVIVLTSLLQSGEFTVDICWQQKNDDCGVSAGLQHNLIVNILWCSCVTRQDTSWCNYSGCGWGGGGYWAIKNWLTNPLVSQSEESNSPFNLKIVQVNFQPQMSHWRGLTSFFVLSDSRLNIFWVWTVVQKKNWLDMKD